MAAAQDFNYKVALAEGLKQLQAGRLRQAEEQFRYLAKKFPGAEGGHRGLAKVLIEMEDRPAALKALRDGAAALARADQRERAIGLLREAIGLEPLDLPVHRNLAAALTLAGNTEGAADEYRRYAEQQLAVGDRAKARADVRYALETLGPIGPLGQLANRLAIDAPSAAPEAAPASSAAGGAPPISEMAPPISELARPPATRASTIEPAAWERAAWERPASPPAAEPVAGAPAVDERLAAVAAVAPAEPALSMKAAAPPRMSPADASEEKAAELLAARDPRAADAALRAARAHLAEGRTSAASDLLLHLVSTRGADHEAQRLLIDIASAVGRRDIARAKEQLLEKLAAL